MSEPTDIDAAVAASLERLGVKQGAATPTEPAASPPSASPSVDLAKLADAIVAKLKPAEASTALASGDDAVAAALRALAGNTAAPTYKSSGIAPSGAPREVLDNDATRWSRDYIERMQADGTFKAELEKFRNSLPGGSNGLFRRKIPGSR
jgi:hypothetical protein